MPVPVPGARKQWQSDGDEAMMREVACSRAGKLGVVMVDEESRSLMRLCVSGVDRFNFAFVPRKSG